MSNAERPVQNIEVGNHGTEWKMAMRSQSIVHRACLPQAGISYFLLCTWYIVLYSPYLCTNSKGLTGFDSRCNHRARMQAGVCTALKDSYERQMAKLLTPWLLNLT